LPSEICRPKFAPGQAESFDHVRREVMTMRRRQELHTVILGERAREPPMLLTRTPYDA
jgi:hypothetical protein